MRERLAQFGPYEDALSQRDPFLFHSVLSAPLNLGLLTPDEVLARVLAVARRQRSVPLSSIEGFVRQLIGWREFVHGVYRRYSEKQAKSNFFGYTRKLTACWYDTHALASTYISMNQRCASAGSISHSVIRLPTTISRSM